jgi:hypothetical protein
MVVRKSDGNLVLKKYMNFVKYFVLAALAAAALGVSACCEKAPPPSTPPPATGKESLSK